MATNEIKYPVLEMMESSDCDDRIAFLFNEISEHTVCWMAFERMEEVLSEKKLRRGLFFSIEKNTIAIRGKTQRILARIWFEAKPVESNKKLYQWNPS